MEVNRNLEIDNGKILLEESAQPDEPCVKFSKVNIRKFKKILSIIRLKKINKQEYGRG
jgi:hypothetical protein